MPLLQRGDVVMFGGQPTPWTQEQLDAIARRNKRVADAGGLLALICADPGLQAFWRRFEQFVRETGHPLTGAQILECKAAEDAANKGAST